MPTRVLSVDGKTLHPAPAPAAAPAVIVDEMSSFHTRYDAVLPVPRPREPLGKLAATRATERAKAQARVDGSESLAAMRRHGAALRQLAAKHQADVAATRSDPNLSDVGKSNRIAQLHRSLGDALIAQGQKYAEQEAVLLATHDGRGTLWASLRDKALASTVQSAMALASVLPQWPPERALAAIETAVRERDLVTMHFCVPLLETLIGDPRYATMQQAADSLLDDARLAQGDEASDAAAIARDVADTMREQLNTTTKMLVKNGGNWDPVFDASGLLSAFDAPNADA